MSNLFEIFDPGLRHAREQLDVEKMLIVESEQGGSGPEPLDLDSGSIVLRVPGHPDPVAEPIAPPADDKDWTWVLEEVCPECGFDAAAVELDSLPERILSATASWPDLLAAPGAQTRPEPLVWSRLEYACHVRDALVIFTERNRLIRTVDTPRFPNWDQDATAVSSRYWEQSPEIVAAELTAATEASAAAWSGIDPDTWQRRGLRSNGSEFSLASLGRYFLHDLVHHLHDVTR